MALAKAGDAEADQHDRAGVVAARVAALARGAAALPGEHGGDDQERERQPRQPRARHVDALALAAAMAATRPSMLKVSACTSGSRPSSLSVVVVIGPMLASFTPASFEP